VKAATGINPQFRSCQRLRLRSRTPPASFMTSFQLHQKRPHGRAVPWRVHRPWSLLEPALAVPCHHARSGAVSQAAHRCSQLCFSPNCRRESPTRCRRCRCEAETGAHLLACGLDDWSSSDSRQDTRHGLWASKLYRALFTSPPVAARSHFACDSSKCRNS
jgi:hypothetical protein